MILALLIACTPKDTTAPDGDLDGVPDAGDCAPTVTSVYPGAAEACNGVDDNCDGLVDEGYDGDRDGYLRDDPGCAALGAPLDCDDADDAVHPGATETCNDQDDDCDDAVDDVSDSDVDGA